MQRNIAFRRIDTVVVLARLMYAYDVMIRDLRAHSEYGCWRSTSSNFLTACFGSFLAFRRYSPSL